MCLLLLHIGIKKKSKTFEGNISLLAMNNFIDNFQFKNVGHNIIAALEIYCYIALKFIASFIAPLIFFWIFSEIDRPLNFNETFVNSSVLKFNVVSINDARFLLKS